MIGALFDMGYTLIVLCIGVAIGIVAFACAVAMTRQEDDPKARELRLRDQIGNDIDRYADDEVERLPKQDPSGLIANWVGGIREGAIIARTGKAPQ